MLSSTLGRPPLIQDHFTLVDLPSEFDDNHERLDHVGYTQQIGNDSAYSELFAETM